jgi:plasmid stabilization system protein ParE
MKPTLYRSDYFNSEFDLRYRYYLGRAGEEVAGRFLEAVLATPSLLVAQPEVGSRRMFRHPALKDMRSFRADRPFEAHLIFYRYTGTELFAERLMRGARDLPRRLREPPDSEAPLV